MYVCTPSDGQGWLVEDGVFHGVSLGADATTEHECGYTAIRMAFGIELDQYGIVGRQIKRLPKSFKLVEDGNDIWLFYGVSLDEEHNRTALEHAVPYPIDFDTEPWGRKTVQFAWSDVAFAIRAKLGTPDADKVRLLYEHFKAMNVAFVAQSLFIMRGLMIVLVDQYPEEENAKWIAKETESQELLDAWLKEAGDIAKVMQKMGEPLNRLPTKNGGRVIRSDDGKLRVWCNPFDQRSYSAGWYTIEDLWAWTRGEGRAIKNKAVS